MVAQDRRAVGVDLGSRRIGVAVGDGAGVLAVQWGTIERSGDRATDHRRITEVVVEAGAVVLVVGLPLRLDGTVGPAAEAVLAEIDELAATVGVPVESYDERLTTVTAERGLKERGMRGRRRRTVIDQLAATVILQGWLDAATGPGR
ncbi:MAG: Holliday junction resolvase RuvX [Actinobacteria bacterium]|nr:Holliday junction resolvase RuvX [Actinomycetota bacterium]